jgi:hypothetical protein
METENNALFLYKGNVVARDKRDDDKVVVLNKKDAKKFGVESAGQVGEDGIAPSVVPTFLRQINIDAVTINNVVKNGTQKP